MRLVGYKRHLHQFGPDGLIEVARKDPDMRGQIRELESFIVKWHWDNVSQPTELRVSGKKKVVDAYQRRKDEDGRVTHDESIRSCACGCGRDVPPHRLKTKGRSSEYYNNACKQRAYRRRNGQIK